MLKEIIILANLSAGGRPVYGRRSEMLLEELKVGISKMSTEDLMKTIFDLRASRRSKKEKPAAKKAAIKTEASLDKMIAELNPTQRAKLAALLGDQT